MIYCSLKKLKPKLKREDVMKNRNGHSWMVWNLANIVSSLRFLTPLVLFFTPWSMAWKMTAYAVFFATDAIDGLIARWSGNCDGIGKVIDSVSDKVCHGSGLIFAIAIFHSQPAETMLFMAIAIGEGFIAILGLYGVYLIGKEQVKESPNKDKLDMYQEMRDQVVAGMKVNMFGKAKMIAYFGGGVSLACFLHWPDYRLSLLYWGFFLLGLVFAWLANRIYYRQFEEWQRRFFL